MDSLNDGPPLGSTEIGQGHRVITWNLMLKQKHIPTKLVKNSYSLRSGDYAAMVDFLDDHDWITLFTDTSVNDDQHTSSDLRVGLCKMCAFDQSNKIETTSALDKRWGQKNNPSKNPAILPQQKPNLDCD